MFGPFYFDYYYIILIIPAMLLGLFAQLKVSSTFNKFSRVSSSRGLTAADIARRILNSNGLQNVQVTMIGGNLTDHYDPRTNVIRLSQSVYSSTSIASIGVAAHEVGHAIQHAEGYLPIKLRNAIVPIANIGSTLSLPLIFLGVLIDMSGLITVGILAFSLVAVFQLVTLPVEYNASNRALATLEQDRFLTDDELVGAKKVLSAAALTYVAALIMSLAQLLRYVMLFGKRGNDRD